MVSQRNASDDLSHSLTPSHILLLTHAYKHSRPHTQCRISCSHTLTNAHVLTHSAESLAHTLSQTLTSSHTVQNLLLTHAHKHSRPHTQCRTCGLTRRSPSQPRKLVKITIIDLEILIDVLSWEVTFFIMLRLIWGKQILHDIDQYFNTLSYFPIIKPTIYTNTLF